MGQFLFQRCSSHTPGEIPDGATVDRSTFSFKNTLSLSGWAKRLRGDFTSVWGPNPLFSGFSHDSDKPLILKLFRQRNFYLNKILHGSLAKLIKWVGRGGEEGSVFRASLSVLQ